MNHLLRILIVSAGLVLAGAAHGQSSQNCGDNTRIQLSTGATEILTCAGDQKPNRLLFETNAVFMPYVLVITNEKDTIQLVTYRREIDFEAFPAGNYRVYALYYQGTLLAKPGMDLYKDRLAGLCYGPSDNFVQVWHIAPDAGKITADDGAPTRFICPGNDKADVVRFSRTSTDPNFRFIITDEQNLVLEVLSSDFYDFEDLPSGRYRVWGFSFIGQPNVQPGQYITDPDLATECFDISDNFVSVVATQPEGGVISYAAGGSSVRLCETDDGNAQFKLERNSTSPAPYGYLLTDTFNVIKAVILSDALDAAALPVGEYRVWGLSFTGKLLAAPGLDAAKQDLSDDCFELSQNFLSLSIFKFPAGRLELADATMATLLCTDGKEPISLALKSNAPAGQDFVFLLTDTHNVVRFLYPANPLILPADLTGNFRVWGVSYSGALLVKPGDQAATARLSTQCYSLTDNFVQVVKRNLNGGVINLPSGSNAETLCFGTVVPSPVLVQATGNSGDNYIYLLTDRLNNIQTISADGKFDLRRFPAGEYHVWGLAYTGILSFPSGANVNATQFSNECADLSDNFITLTKIETDGAQIRLADGRTNALFCATGNAPIRLDLVNTATIQQDYAYLLTDTNNIVLEVSTGNVLELQANATGNFRVWGLAYSGALLTKAGVDAATFRHAASCFELSANFIQIRKQNVLSGSISLADGSEKTQLCYGQNAPSALEVKLSGTIRGEGQVFLVTDTLNNILAVSSDEVVQVSKSFPASYRIWGLSYTGQLNGALVGQNAARDALASECYVLSPNFIMVSWQEVDGAQVSLSSGGTERTICLGQQSGFISFRNTTQAAATYRYLLTDQNDRLILALIGASIDISVAPAGTYRVYGVSYTGNFQVRQGEKVSEAIISSGCYALSSNFITLRNQAVTGGAIRLSNLALEQLVCPDATSGTTLRFLKANQSGDNYAYLVTDIQNNILAVTTTDSFNFSSLPLGVYRVWGLAYGGALLAVPGQNTANTRLSDACYSLSSNFLTIRKQPPAAGTVRLNTGAATAYTCPGADRPQQLFFTLSGQSGGQTAYLLTDTNQVILQVVRVGLANLDTFPAGFYRIWGLAYNGNLLAERGMNAATANLAESCFALTTNFISVIHQKPEGGAISAQGNPGNLCIGDKNSNLVQFSRQNASLTPYVFLIADDSNRFVQVVDDSNRIDFERVAGGNLTIWGLAYTGKLTINAGQSLADGSLSDGCFDLSDNSISILRSNVDGGRLIVEGQVGDTTYVCPNDGVNDIIAFTNTSTAKNAQYRYVLTNASNLVLAILSGNTQNFENAGFRELRVWGVSFTGNFLLGTGRNLLTATLSDGCAVLSQNYITVIREVPDGGAISTAGGATQLHFCPGRDGMAIALKSNTRSRAGYAYLMTNTQGVIVAISRNSQINLKQEALGEYTIRGLSYTGNLRIKVGDTLRVTDSLSTSCFDLSDNTVQITRGGEVDGQQVVSLFGDSIFYTCPGDGLSDIVIVIMPDSDLDAEYRLLITDEQNRVLFPDIESNLIDFEPSAAGTYRIWGISYTGELTIQFGSILDNGNLSTDCYDLSDNFITVVAQKPIGGTVSTADNQTAITVKSGDGQPDPVRFTRKDASPKTPYIFLLTDTDNVILALSLRDSFNLETLSAGNYRVWGLAYTGVLLASPGADADRAPLADNCFDLSDNFVAITVTRDNFQEEVLPQVNSRSHQHAPSMKVAPNPVLAEVRINFTLTGQSEDRVSLQLFSLDGKLIQNKEWLALPGANETTLNLQDQRAGVYLLRLQYGNIVEVERVVKVGN